MSELQSQAQAGYMMQGLTQHIKSMLPKNVHHHMDVWMEDLQAHMTPINQGLGFDIGFIEYSAEFRFERFPFKKVDPAIVIAGVMAWLMDNDHRRDEYELDDPSFDIEPESDDTVIMTMELDFIEPLKVIEDDQGPILWNGKRFKLAPYEIWVAETVSVQGSDMEAY